MNKRDIVLLVEREDQYNSSRRRFLQEKGFSVISETSPQEGAAAVRPGRKPDLILMELDPVDPGLALEAVRNILSQNNIPVVFLYSSLEAETIIALEKVTFYGLIPKNAQPNLLLITLRQALNLFQNNHVKLLAAEEHRPLTKEPPDTASLLKKILDSVPADVYVGDMERYEILFMNETMKRDFGGDFTGQICHKVFRNSDLPCPNCPIQKLIEPSGNPGGTVVWSDYNPVSQRWWINYDYGISWFEDRKAHIQFAVDISEMKKTENKLSSALKEKELLLRELQHRVKNNLAMMLSLIDMEKEKLKNPELKALLGDLENRIHTLSELYNLLYETGTGTIPLNRYIQEICRSLGKSEKITLTTELEEIDLDIKRATSLGIIVNELITNASKYAFSEKTGGNIRIALSKEEGSLILTVQDDGKGFPADYRTEDSIGFGLKLVEVLTEELGGCFFQENSAGTIFRVKIPE